MKRFLFLLFLFLPQMISAQDTEVVKEYCIVMLDISDRPIWDIKVKPRYAYALMEDSEYAGIITSSKGERLLFKNDVHLLNYMSRQGWELHADSRHFSKVDGNDKGRYYQYIFWRYKEIPVENESGD